MFNIQRIRKVILILERYINPEENTPPFGAITDIVNDQRSLIHQIKREYLQIN